MELMVAHVGCAGAACRVAAPTSEHKHAYTCAPTTACMRHGARGQHAADMLMGGDSEDDLVAGSDDLVVGSDDE